LFRPTGGIWQILGKVFALAELPLIVDCQIGDVRLLPLLSGK